MVAAFKNARQCLAYVMLSRAQTESWILAAAGDALGEEPFSTRELVEELVRRHPQLRVLEYDSLRSNISRTLTDNGFHKGMIGRTSHWHSHPFVSSKRGEYVHKTREVTTKLLRHRNILATLYYRFGTKKFRSNEAAKLIEDTCDYTRMTAATYVNHVLAAASTEPTELGGKQIMARKIRSENRGHRTWELYSA